MPQLAMIEVTSRATRSETTRSPVTGFTPPKARVAAMTARSRTVTSTRALAEVRLHRVVDRSVDHPVRPEQVGQRAVAFAGGGLGRVDGLVHQSERPAKADITATMRPVRSSMSPPAISAVVAIAPALTIGLAGRPVPASRLIALNGSPLGSAPTRASTASRPRLQRERQHERLRHRLDRELGAASPTVMTRPRGPTTAKASSSGSTVRQLGDVDAGSPAS